MSYDRFEAQDKTYFDQNLRDQGLRIVALELQGGKYTAVWRPGSGAQSWKPGMSYAEFKSQVPRCSVISPAVRVELRSFLTARTPNRELTSKDPGMLW